MEPFKTIQEVLFKKSTPLDLNNVKIYGKNDVLQTNFEDNWHQAYYKMQITQWFDQNTFLTHFDPNYKLILDFKNAVICLLGSDYDLHAYHQLVAKAKMGLDLEEKLEKNVKYEAIVRLGDIYSIAQFITDSNGNIIPTPKIYQWTESFSKFNPEWHKKFKKYFEYKELPYSFIL